jgi:phosphoenolpyruvate phosphomutase
VTVLVCGVFDLLHADHLRLLERAARLGPVTVGLLTDELAAGYKRRPVLSYWERRAALEILPWVDRIVRKVSHDTRDLLRQYEPDYLVTGSDWSQGAFYELNHLTVAWMELHEMTLVVVPSARTITTSLIIDRILSSSPPGSPLSDSATPSGL